MFRFFSVQNASNAFSQPVLVQRFVVGKNDDADIVLKEILCIRGNPVGITTMGIHRYAVPVMPFQSVAVMIHVFSEISFISFCGQQFPLLQAFIPLLQIVTIRDQRPGTRQEQVIDIRYTNCFPVIVHIVICFVFVDGHAVVKNRADHPERKEYILTQKFRVRLL